MLKILRKRLNHNVVCDLLRTLDPSFAERLEETVNIDDYSRKLSDNAYFEVAENNSNIDGIIAFYENKSEIYIPYVCVSVFKRRMGIADALLNSVCNYASLVCKPISLEVRVSNIRAIRLYEKFGFKIMNEKESKFYMKRHYCPVKVDK